MNVIRRIVEGAEPRTPSEHLTAGALSLISGVYAGITSGRTYLYDLHCMKAKKLEAPVVCIGNLTVGGTGKTPVTIAVAEHFVAKGLRPAIISRGYGATRRHPSQLAIVSRGDGPIVSPDMAGDEPFLIAQRTRKIPVVVCADRYAAGRTAIGELGASIVVMDDGFQHRQLHRDLDFVLLDASRDPERMRLFPRGALREPFGALRRAGLIGLTRSENSPFADSWKELARKYASVPILAIKFKPVGAFQVFPHESPVDWKAESPVFAFCAIGNPDAFFASARRFGANLCGTKAFNDHHKYEAEDFASLLREASESGAQCLLTTEKDAAKFPALPAFDLPIYVQKIRAQFDLADFDRVFEHSAND